MAAAVLGSTAAFYVAVAGGSGAFLGAVVGQVIQAVRDVRLTRVEDRRRAEDRNAELDRERRDHQRNAYVEIMGGCAQLGQHVENMVEVAGTLVAAEGDSAKMTAALLDEWQPVAREFDQTSASLQTLVTAFGSPEISEAFSLLHVIRPTVHKLASRRRFTTRLITVADGHLERRSAVSGHEHYGVDDYMADTVEVFDVVLHWLIGQARFELRIDPVPPTPTGFALDPASVGAARSRTARRADPGIDPRPT